jgi:hypothetical protein
MADHEPIEQKLTDFYEQSRARMSRPIPSWNPTRRQVRSASGLRQLAAAGAIAVFVLAVAGGGYFLRTNVLPNKRATTQGSNSPEILSSGSRGLTTSATATAAPATSGPLAVFVGGAGPSNYVVSLVNARGQTVASATAARRSNSTGTALPEVSASATRVYYLDSDAQVRSLTPDGHTADVVKLEGTPQVHAAFAVSPDDLRIAVTTIDYSKNPPARHLYVSDLTGANRSEVVVSGNAYVWPVAWHDGNLVLASGNASPVPVASPDITHPWCDPSAGPCTADNPYGAVHGFELVDPATGKLLANLGSDQCQPMGLLTSAGTLCREGWAPGGLITQTQECKPTITTCLRLADWTGAFTEWTTLATVWIGALTPSATQMAGCCNVDAINVYEPRSAGGGITRIHNSASPIAWMDDYNLIYQPFNSTAMQLFSVTGGTDVPIAAPGVPVAILPAG